MRLFIHKCEGIVLMHQYTRRHWHILANQQRTVARITTLQIATYKSSSVYSSLYQTKIRTRISLSVYKRFSNNHNRMTSLWKNSVALFMETNTWIPIFIAGSRSYKIIYYVWADTLSNEDLKRGSLSNEELCQTRSFVKRGAAEQCSYYRVGTAYFSLLHYSFPVMDRMLTKRDKYRRKCRFFASTKRKRLISPYFYLTLTHTHAFTHTHTHTKWTHVLESERKCVCLSV